MAPPAAAWPEGMGGAPGASGSPEMPEGSGATERTGPERFGDGSGLPVRVTRVSPKGAVHPVGDAEVLLEHWVRPPGRDAERELDGVWRGRTDARGRVRFPGTPTEGNGPSGPHERRGPGGSSSGEWIPVTVDDGVLFRGQSLGDRRGEEPLSLRLYEATTDRSALGASLRLGLSVHQGRLVVQSVTELRNDGRQLVDLRDGDPLRVPVLLPEVMGRPMDRGLLPREAASDRLVYEVTPERGRLVLDEGALWYEGPVPPGDGPRIRVRYTLPIVAARQDLALTTPLDLERLVVTSTWSRWIDPRVLPSVAGGDREDEGRSRAASGPPDFTVAERRQGEQRQRFFHLDRAPEAGETVHVRVDRLPRPERVLTGAATVGAVLLLALFGLGFAALRQRRSEGAAERSEASGP